MRLIDAEFLTEIITVRIKPDGHEMTNKFMQKFIDVVKAMPKIDAVPVVRCEYCKHKHINSFGMESRIVYCLRHGMSKQYDDFCSYGER